MPAGFAAALKEGASTRSADIAHRIHEKVPEFTDRAAVTQQTTDAVRSLISAFARRLERGAPEERLEVPAEAIEYVRAFVHRGFDLELLLRVYQLGHRELWNLCVELLEERGEGERQHAVGLELFSFIEVLTQRVVREYQSERERWIRSSQALRTQIVGNLVSGRRVSAHDASARLRYDLGGYHSAFVFWSEEESGVDSDAAPTTAARSLTAGLNRPSIVIPMGRRTAYAWSVQPEGAALEIPELNAGEFGNCAVSVAVGEPRRGVDGFRASHFDAIGARRIAVIAAMRMGSVVRWADVATLGLLSADLEHARRFTSQELGPLDANDDSAARLRSTLMVYLQENDRRRTAERLGIHTNTVAYRLRQCEDILDHSVADRRFKLEAALRLRDSLKVSSTLPVPQLPTSPWTTGPAASE